MAKDKSNLSHVRRKIEKEMEIAAFERKRMLKARRIELARDGYRAYNSRKFTTAVRSFQGYIRILEEINELEPGQLLPTHFNLKKALSELLMISGIYWDLAKVYDRTRSREKYLEFQHYIEKFVLFSRNLPHQALCTEALRKYIVGEKPVHKEDFKHAYHALETHKCFVASSLIDVISESTIPSLQNFRDQVLSRSLLGRQFIRWYYRWGPSLAKGVDKLPQIMRKRLGGLLDALSRRLNIHFTQDRNLI